MTPERALWSAYEPIHAIVYFDPAVSSCLSELGLHGFWNGYFAGRAAPMGPVGPEPVTATFFGFAHPMVAKAIPKVWGRVSPADAVTARLAAVSRTLSPLIEAASVDDVRRVADLLTPIALKLDTGGRVLAAAWQGVAVPDDLAARLWWAITVIREHRGDGHVLAAIHAGLSGLENTVTHVAVGPITRELMQPNRGWSDDDWDAAISRLAERGLITPDGNSLTQSGTALRDQIEAATDRLSGVTLGDDLTWVRGVLGGLATAIAAAGSLPLLNPMGVPLPD